MWNNQPTFLRKCGIFLACVTFSETERKHKHFHKTKLLMNSPALCWFSNRLCSQVSVRTGTRRSFLLEDGVHEDPLHFVYIYYVSQLYKLYFWNNCKTLLCNVMVVLLYLLCALDLILNVESTPEMFPPSVFGVWQIGIRALVYSEWSIPNLTWYKTINIKGPKCSELKVSYNI